MNNLIEGRPSTPKGLISLIALLTGASAGFYGLVTLVALVLGCAVTTGTGAVGLAVYAAILVIAGLQFLHLGFGLVSLPHQSNIRRNLFGHLAV
jgi:hypothetical protein